MSPDGARPGIAVVTGGTRGIGRAISLDLAGDGRKVFALYARNRRAADTLAGEAEARGLDIVCLRGDLSRDAPREAVLDALGAEATPIDVLVHAAATGVHRSADALTEKHLRFTLETNVVAFHAMLRALLPRMGRGTRVIALTSAGGTRTIDRYAAVGASKGALEALTRHWAVELAPRGIAVNLVCPGLVLTDAVDAFPDRDRRIGTAHDETPSGRLTTPADVAAAVRFLCSEGAAQIIGQTIVIDGGKNLPS